MDFPRDLEKNNYKIFHRDLIKNLRFSPGF